MNQLLITIALVCFAVGSVRAAESVIAFPQNERYGCVIHADTTLSPQRWYDIVRVPSGTGADTVPSIVRSIQSQRVPSMCSLDAVSYLEVSGDSARVMVLRLDSPERLDTVFTGLSRRGYKAKAGGMVQFPEPPGMVSISSCYFWLQDSLLFWKPIWYVHGDPLEIGRIDSTGNVNRIEILWEASLPTPDVDFSELLYASEFSFPTPEPFGRPGSSIISYDVSTHSFSTLDSVEGRCFGVTRRSQDDTLWCLAYTGEMDQNLCHIVDGRLAPVTDLKYPRRVSAFRLYRDSVVIDTITCCGNGLAR